MSAAMSGVGLFGDMNMLRPMQQAAPPLVKPPNDGSPRMAPPRLEFATGLGNGGVGIGGGAADASSGWLDLFLGIGGGSFVTIGLVWPVAPTVPLLWAANWGPNNLVADTGTDFTQLQFTVNHANRRLAPSSRPYRIDWRVTQT